MSPRTEESGPAEWPAFHGHTAPMWASSGGLVSVLRQEADEDPRLHRTMWNTERDQALLRTAADRIEALTDLVGAMWLYIDDRYATRNMTTAQRTLFADLIDEQCAGHGSVYDRWWLTEPSSLPVRTGHDTMVEQTGDRPLRGGTDGSADG